MKKFVTIQSLSLLAVRRRTTDAVRSVLLAWVAASCMAWGPARPATVPSAESPSGELRVTLRNGTVVGVREARVDGDSIVGLSEPPQKDRVAIATGDVASVEQRRFSALRTTGLVVAIGLAALIALLAVAVQSLPPDY